MSLERYWFLYNKADYINSTYMSQIFKYIRRHWRGELSLVTSFWVNYVLLNIFLNITIVFSGFICRSRGYWGGMFFVELFVGVCLLIVYPWQAIGIWRACNSHIQIHKRHIWPHIIQFVIFLTIMANIMGVVEFTTDPTIFYFLGMKTNQEQYSLTLTHDTTIINFKGELTYGVSSEVKKILKKHHNIEGIILSTEGGQSVEGALLARLIYDYSLNTYAYDKCYSAGTTAFIAGENRFLIEEAKLGFHRSELFETTNNTFRKFLILRRQAYWFTLKGIKKDFIAKIFNTPNDSIWCPGIEELLNAGVINGVVDINLVPLEQRRRNMTAGAI